jgi:hypothetical protein
MKVDIIIRFLHTVMIDWITTRLKRYKVIKCDILLHFFFSFDWIKIY